MGVGDLFFESPPSLRVAWTIPDFFRLTESTYTLHSPDFAFADGRHCLRMFQTPDLDVDFIGIELLNLTDTDPGRAVLFEVQLRSRTREIETGSRISDKRTFWFNRSTRELREEQYLPDGALTVLCSVRLAKQRGSRRAESSGAARARIVPAYRTSSGELSFQSFPFLYVAWRIPAFFRRESTYALDSPEFSFSDRRYHLRLLQSGSRQRVVDIHLVNSNDAVPGRHVSYEVGLTSTSGEEIYISRRHESATREFYIFRNALEAMRPVRFPDGHLTVFCSMRSREPSAAGSSMSGGAETAGSTAAAHPKSSGAETSNEEEDKAALPGISKLSLDLKQLLQKMPDSDASLVVSGKEFLAHRMMLRARSTVFDAMFGHETAERESGRVVIDDLDPDSFGDFLEYLYTGTIGAGLSDDNVFGLYEAADKYDVPTLKAECAAHMRRHLSVDSFCDVLAVALRHREEELLTRAVLFFKENMARIIVTVKWQQFVIDNGTSANELLIKAVVPPGQ